ncbi:hypothetical protein EKE94_11920 [Mesobaculum littorinae]|uniref:Uncharacterized protein n=1 Tax=Mesobaculum littorinae TaxID=2486419 RepID=A0A438AHF3_9RHOB|nr:hypothetical protein [Mesobaculum littorinae]RVV98151.1 hypothetical protein EKE94_11920 [Mesobaculum littorinae]
MRRFPLILAATLLAAHPAAARVCDYRLSGFIGGKGPDEAAGTAPVATGGAVEAVKGFYSLSNTATGATLLSQGGGAGGLVAGAGKGLGTAAGVLSTPAALTAGAVLGLGVGAMEGVCFFRDERITDPATILAILDSMSDAADPAYFLLDPAGGDPEAAILYMRDDKGEPVAYDVRDLYIVNGQLKHRKWGPNRSLGRVDYVQTSGAAVPSSPGAPGTPDATAAPGAPSDAPPPADPAASDAVPGAALPAPVESLPLDAVPAVPAPAAQPPAPADAGTPARP